MNQIAPAHKKRNPTSLAISYQATVFSAVLFAGRLEDGLAAAHMHGFDAVEIGLRDPGVVDTAWLSRKLEQYQLGFSAIATGQSFYHDGLSLFASSPEISLAAMDRIKQFIIIAEKFGAFVVLGGIRGKLVGEKSDRDRQWALGIQAIRQCALFAQDHGVTLLLEPINRYETNVVNTAEDGLRMLAELDVPNIKLLMDTFHMNIEEPSVPVTIEKLESHLGYIHFADSNRHAPGQGHIPFTEILSALQKIDYAGYISAEILPLPEDSTAASLAGTFLAQLFTEN